VGKESKEGVTLLGGWVWETKQNFKWGGERLPQRGYNIVKSLSLIIPQTWGGVA